MIRVGVKGLRVDEIKAKYQSGMRIELVEMVGEPDMPIGLQGKIDGVDDIGNILVSWSNGRSLSLIPDRDKFKVLG